MEIFLLVIALAAVWHIGLALLEKHRYPEQDRPSLARLLLLAEVEVLRTLRTELKRQRLKKQESQCERKLSQVEERLKELGEDGTGVEF